MAAANPHCHRQNSIKTHEPTQASLSVPELLINKSMYRQGKYFEINQSLDGALGGSVAFPNSSDDFPRCSPSVEVAPGSNQCANTFGVLDYFHFAKLLTVCRHPVQKHVTAIVATTKTRNNTLANYINLTCILQPTHTSGSFHSLSLPRVCRSLLLKTHTLLTYVAPGYHFALNLRSSRRTSVGAAFSPGDARVLVLKLHLIFGTLRSSSSSCAKNLVVLAASLQLACFILDRISSRSFSKFIFWCRGFA